MNLKKEILMLLLFALGILMEKKEKIEDF